MIPLFKVSVYQLYLLRDNNEPVNVHISKDGMTKDATKIWISSRYGALVCHNNSKISSTKIFLLRRFIEAFAKKIVKVWEKNFGEVKFYC